MCYKTSAERKFKPNQRATTLSEDNLSFELLQDHYQQMSFTETYELISPVQELNITPEDKTKDPIAMPKGISGCIDFPEECNVTQTKPYIVYNINQVTQTLLYVFFRTPLKYIISTHLLTVKLIIIQIMYSIRSQLTYRLP